MPVTGKVVFDQDQRASWFSHKAEVAKPYYYKVYLADHDVTTEIAPTSRAAMFRFTFPESKDSYVVVDAFDNGSYVKVIPEENKIIGYTTKNSGGVPENFKNYFVLVFGTRFWDVLRWKTIIPIISVHSTLASIVRYFSREASTNWMPKGNRYITVPTTVKCCRDICLPIPVSGIHSAACSRSST